MNLTELLKFLPLILGGFLAYHLIFSQKLPSQSIGKILTYFVGILIVFVAISWIITTFLAQWATNMLQAGTNSSEWQQFIDNSEGVVQDAFSQDSLPAPTAVPVSQPAILVVTVTPIPGSSNSGGDRAIVSGQASVYMVVAGDTLFDIANRNNTTVDAIVRQNGLTSYVIHPGDQLIIPSK